MYFEKRYLQFNDLVFDGYDMISNYDEPLQFKGSSTAISFGHGSYAPFKNSYLYVSERQVNMTISLKLKKMPCEYREFYVRFAIQELSKPGKLWAIRGNEILWANARVNNMRPVNNGRQDIVVFDVEFVVPGGVWYKADKQKTFLLPYEVCTLMDCKGFEEYNPCSTAKGEVGCCDSCDDRKSIEERRTTCGCCCEDEVSADMALCYHTDELQAYYGCDTPYQLKYDCEAAERFNHEPAFGQRLCVEDSCKDAVIGGQIYSETDIPTEELTITLRGDMKSPWININGNMNIIEGEYHGILTIHSNGEVYYTENECCDPELLDPSVWSIPSGNDYGWTIYPHMNSVIIYMNMCCSQSGKACAYIDHSPITM